MIQCQNDRVRGKPFLMRVCRQTVQKSIAFLAIRRTIGMPGNGYLESKEVHVWLTGLPGPTARYGKLFVTQRLRGFHHLPIQTTGAGCSGARYLTMPFRAGNVHPPSGNGCHDEDITADKEFTH